MWPSAGRGQASRHHVSNPAVLRLHASAPYSHFIEVAAVNRLVANSPALSDDLGHLVDLSLRTAESTESLLCKLAGTLVLAVAEKFDDAALVWCEAIGMKLVSCPVLSCSWAKRTQRPP